MSFLHIIVQLIIEFIDKKSTLPYVNNEVSNNYYFSFYQAMLAGLAIMFTGSDNGVEMLIRALDME